MSSNFQHQAGSECWRSGLDERSRCQVTASRVDKVASRIDQVPASTPRPALCFPVPAATDHHAWCPRGRRFRRPRAARGYWCVAPTSSIQSNPRTPCEGKKSWRRPEEIEPAQSAYLDRRATPRWRASALYGRPVAPQPSRSKFPCHVTHRSRAARGASAGQGDPYATQSVTRLHTPPHGYALRACVRACVCACCSVDPPVPIKPEASFSLSVGPSCAGRWHTSVLDQSSLDLNAGTGRPHAVCGFVSRIDLTKVRRAHDEDR